MPPCECLWLKASAWVSNKTQRESTGILLQPEIDLMLSLRGVEKESCTRYIAHHIPHPLSHTLPAAVWHCCCHCFPLLHFAQLLVLLFLLLSWKNESMLIDVAILLRLREKERIWMRHYVRALKIALRKLFKVLPTGSLHAAVRFCGRQCEQSLRVMVHVNLSHSWLRLHCFSGCRHDLVRTLGRGLENIRNLSWILSDSSSA